MAQPSGHRPGPTACARSPLCCLRGRAPVAPLFSGGARPRSSFPSGPSPVLFSALQAAASGWALLGSLEGSLLLGSRHLLYPQALAQEGLLFGHGHECRSAWRAGRWVRKRPSCCPPPAPVTLQPETWGLSLTCSAPTSVLLSPPLLLWGPPPPPPLPGSGPSPCCAGGAVALRRSGSEARSGCAHMKTSGFWGDAWARRSWVSSKLFDSLFNSSFKAVTALILLRRCKNWVSKILLATSKGSFYVVTRALSSKRDWGFACAVAVSVAWWFRLNPRPFPGAWAG